MVAAEVVLSELDEAHPVACPSCQQVLATVDKDGVTMMCSDAYLADDGDCIPVPLLEIAGMAAVPLASVGYCSYCQAKHWLLEVRLHPAGGAAVIDSLEQDYPWEQSFIVGSSGQLHWSLHKYRSPVGEGWTHSIGPLKVPEGVVTHGQNGVSACGGGAFWKHAKGVLVELMPQIEAAHSVLAK